MIKAITRPAFLWVVATLCLFGGCQRAQSETDDETVSKAGLEADISQASYTFGYEQTERLQRETQDVLDMQAYAAGVRDFVSGSPRQVSAADTQRLMEFLQNEVQAKAQAAQDRVTHAVVEAGDAYRAEFATKPGVVETSSGLLYEIMTKGSGPKPKDTDTVTTHYHGTLISGDVFDSSVDRGQPASFPVNGVIKGWTEALQMMPVGSKWRLVIPPELAYGERGAGGQIGPHTTLVFEVELLEIK